MGKGGHKGKGGQKGKGKGDERPEWEKPKRDADLERRFSAPIGDNPQCQFCRCTSEILLSLGKTTCPLYQSLCFYTTTYLTDSQPPPSNPYPLKNSSQIRFWVSAYLQLKCVLLAKSLLSDFNPISYLVTIFQGVGVGFLHIYS